MLRNQHVCQVVMILHNQIILLQGLYRSYSLDQCLYLKPCDGEQAVYAALWPWASDPRRVTLKVGTLALKASS